MKKIPFYFPSILLFIPFITHAQTLQDTILNIIDFVDAVFIPALLSIAFVIFVFNAVKYFVIQGHSEDGREKAKSLAMYAVLAFVLIIIFWGVIRLLSTSLGLEGEAQPISDYCPPAGCL